MEGTLPWLIVVACVAAATFFSACNYALRLFNRTRLEEALEKRRRSHWLAPAVLHHHRLVLTTATIRIILNIVLILALVATAPSWAVDHPAVGLPAAGLLALLLITTFSVAVANAWAKYSGEALLARTLGMLQLVRRIFLPVTAFLGWMDEIVRRLAGAPAGRDHEDDFERQIMSAVSEGEREGVVDAEEKDMIESVLEFQDTRTESIMTPRTEIKALEVNSNLEQVLQTVREAGHSRIPVFEENLDNIVGVLYAKDVLLHNGADDDGRPLDIRKVMRGPLFVPESKPLGDLLAELRRRKVHLAIVLDEFGGTAGLVTIEDILEEIVGEIADEHEQPEPQPIRRVDEHTWELEGRVHIDDINDEIEVNLPEDEDYDTISGLVLSQLGHIPKAGEAIRHQNVTITVLEADPRKINRLRLQIAPVEPQIEEINTRIQ